MRHWMPKLVYGLNQPPQSELISKFGGLPWGLPVELWPNCKECGRPMHFLAQLTHQPPMLDIGEDQVLHAFICNFDSICSFWDADAGANAVTLLARNRLGTGLTPYPADRVPAEETDSQPTMFLDLHLQDWEAFDDHLTDDQLPLFYDPEAFWDLPDDVAHPHDFDLVMSNKAGPIPYWTGNGPSPRLANTEIILQVTGDNMPVFDTPPDRESIVASYGNTPVDNVQILEPMFGQIDGGHSYVNWANFCSDGTGFIFREQTPNGLRYGLEILR